MNSVASGDQFILAFSRRERTSEGLARLRWIVDDFYSVFQSRSEAERKTRRTDP